MALKKSTKLRIKKTSGALLFPENTEIDEYVVNIKKDTTDNTCTAKLYNSGETSVVQGQTPKALDTAMSTTSTNGVQNKVITKALSTAADGKLDKKTPGYKAVYGVTEGGDQYTFPFTENAATASTVVGRNNSGQIFCENPTEAKHAVNYEYFGANVPDSSTRFATDKEHTSSESGSREMTVYSNDKAAGLVLDCGGYTNDCAKALIFTDTKAYWGNDSFDYIDTNMIQGSGKDSLYRITYYPETHTFVVLTNNSVRRMMMIGI